MERNDWIEFSKIYPTQKARIAADLALDNADVNISLIEACKIWNDAYNAAGGIITKLKKK